MIYTAVMGAGAATMLAETVAFIAALRGGPRRGLAALGVRRAVNLIAIFVDVAFVLDQVGFVGRAGLAGRLGLLRIERLSAIRTFCLRWMKQKSKR